jgi:hypothetical protein
MTEGVDTMAWRMVGTTTNCRFFEVEPYVLAVVPLALAIDDEKTALENYAFEEGYFQKLGHAGVSLVLVDNAVSQDKGARRVYQKSRSTQVVAVALVAGTLLGRAIASFLLGSRESGAPVKMFATVEDALPWARSHLKISPNAEPVQ